jgi:hypothetical protein
MASIELCVSFAGEATRSGWYQIKKSIRRLDGIRSRKRVSPLESGASSKWRPLGEAAGTNKKSPASICKRHHRLLRERLERPCRTRVDKRYELASSNTADASIFLGKSRGRAVFGSRLRLWAASMSAMGVRRAKAALSSGCKSHPATAPAGSNRSSHGGNEVAEAFD